MRHWAKLSGFGRINVVAGKGRQAGTRLGQYLGKYLTKALRSGQQGGARMWSSFGYGRKVAVRLKDIAFEAPGGEDYLRAYCDAKDGGANHWAAAVMAAKYAWDRQWAAITGDLGIRVGDALGEAPF
ncbi:MAG: hypothetical protein IPL86_16735 [Flavobacteriales bacterium]|nr:hypothetical protein [Flavobacteriales bacterium]